MSQKFHLPIFNLVNNLGWSYTQKSIADVAAHLEAEGFVFTETDEIVSPSGEFFGAAVGRLWDEPAPGEKPAPTVVGGFQFSGPKTIFDAQARERDLTRMLETKQKLSPGGEGARHVAPVSPAEIERATGLSPEAFAKRDPEYKLSIENEIKFNRGK